MYHVVYGLLLCVLHQLIAGDIVQDSKDVLLQYEQFKKKYNKTFGKDEDYRRFNIFKENLKQAMIYQQQESGTAKYGVTQFFDLTAREFRERYLTAKFPETVGPDTPFQEHGVVQLPNYFNWCEHGAVGPVLNQGDCGACWAFSAVQNIEGQWFLRHGQLLSLSVQELVDCDTNMDHGCQGGYPPHAFKAVQQLGGLELAYDYPYVGRVESCRFDKRRIVASITGWTTLPKNENAIADYLYKHGPVSAGINSGPLRYYTSGIFNPPQCNPKGLDHAILLVGFGTEGNTPYWIIKNTWGPNWGEQGYFRLYRGANTCGIAEVASSSIVA